MLRFGVAIVFSTTVVAPPAIWAQTLDELQKPLLSKGRATVDLDYGQFALEHAVAIIGAGRSTYFEPPNYSFLPVGSVGISRKIQLNLSGSYVFPVLRSYALFAGLDSPLNSHWLVKSLRAEVVVRPSESLEFGVASLTGRSRYDSAFPKGDGTSLVDTFTTNALQVRGLWLPHADSVSRPLRADLDGLTAPLLRSHHARVEWDLLWRRYGSTHHSESELFGAVYDTSDTVRSTDVRMRLGASYGATGRVQVTGDVYWQPPFTVANPIFVRETFLGEVRDSVDDESRRLSDVYGWRANARWRPADRLDVFGETSTQHQFVVNGPATPWAWDTDFRQRVVSTGATWLSRSGGSGTSRQADLNGLYGPLLEKHQLRVDAILHFLRYREDEVRTDGSVWCVGATLGVASSLQANFSAGRFRVGDYWFQKGALVSAGLRFRPAKRIEAYGTFKLRPLTSGDRYPAFILPLDSFAQSFHDFTDTSYDDDISLHIGVRFGF